MATSAKTKMQQVIEEAQGITKRETKTTAATKTEVKVDDKFSDIENNTFYSVIFSEATPEEKKAAVEKHLTFVVEDGKEKNLERLQEFTLFKEYLQDQRKRMAQEIIALTDTGAFSELKGVLDDLNKGLIEFDERMLPLTQILDACYELRKAGGETVLGVFKEIKDDQAAEQERIRKVAENEAKLQGFNGSITNTNVDIEMLKKERKWFGLGGIKESAQREILMKEAALQQINADVSSTTQELIELRDPSKARESKFAEYAEQKVKIRELLDISSDEHKDRQKALVNAAQNFVTTTDQRVGSVLGHLDSMSGQVQNLFDANNGMTTIYAVLTDASQAAAMSNQSLRASFEQPEGTETMIQKMQRETKKMNVDEHITNLGNSTIETVKTMADLSTQGVRIKAMKDANREQVSKTRELHSSGVAGVADRLSMVLQAVSSAALNESSEAAKMSVNTMNDKTNAVAMQESIRTAMGLADVATGINRAIDDLEQYKQGVEVAKKITRENLTAIQDGMAVVREKSQEVRDALKEAIAVGADVDLAAGTNKKAAANTNEAEAPAAPKPSVKGASSDPFKKLKAM